jgi:hypothetical protein
VLGRGFGVLLVIRGLSCEWVIFVHMFYEL